MVVIKYDWSMKTEPSKGVDAFIQFAKTKLPPVLEAKLAEFPVALIDTHGKDLTVSGEPSRTGTPVASVAVAGASVPKPQTTMAKVNATSLNTTTVTVEANFMASAADLFSILTDEKRIPSWSRAPATVRWI
jgi:activator of HSP90 ATPase